MVSAVDALTHREGETRADYYQRILLSPLALRVKAADIDDNADPERLARLDRATRERLTAKYEKARKLLGLDALRLDRPDRHHVGHGRTRTTVAGGRAESVVETRLNRVTTDTRQALRGGCEPLAMITGTGPRLEVELIERPPRTHPAELARHVARGFRDPDNYRLRMLLIGGGLRL